MTNRTFARASLDIALSAAGWCAVGLGTAGVFVPGLPTTVFIIIAFYCFSRSSSRFARWLSEHQRLGSVLKPFLVDGGLSGPAKRAALTAMWTSILVSSAMLARVHVAAALTTVGLGIAGTMAIRFGVRTVPECSNVAKAAL
jgi:uncharacterized membrane protein YbaN (DUF454 family)